MEVMKKFARVTAVGVLCLVIASGCEVTRVRSSNSTSKDKDSWSAGQKDPGKALSPAAITEELAEFPDVPVPSSFEFIPEKSFTAVSDDYRIGHLFYTGRLSVFEIVNFYRDQMPISGWKLQDIVGMHTKVMDFVREKEAKGKCRISITPSGRKAEIIIDVY